jgi:hypothetical protein
MPEQPEQYSSPMRRRFAGRSVLPVVLGLLLGSGLIGLFVTVNGALSLERLVGVGVIVAILGLAWLDNRLEVWSKERPWRELAMRTGLTCQVGGWLHGYAVQVVGSYRGRPLTLYTPKRGKGQVPATRIELRLPNPTNAMLRLRGPFPRDEAVHDQVTRELFGATAAQQFGNDQRFFIRSRPLHLATGLLSSGPLWERLQHLETLTSIELDGATLVFEQMGVLRDAAQLQAFFELLSNIATLIEESHVAARQTPPVQRRAG